MVLDNSCAALSLITLEALDAKNGPLHMYLFMNLNVSFVASGVTTQFRESVHTYLPVFSIHRRKHSLFLTHIRAWAQFQRPAQAFHCSLPTSGHELNFRGQPLSRSTEPSEAPFGSIITSNSSSRATQAFCAGAGSCTTNLFNKSERVCKAGLCLCIKCDCNRMPISGWNIKLAAFAISWKDTCARAKLLEEAWAQVGLTSVLHIRAKLWTMTHQVHFPSFHSLYINNSCIVLPGGDPEAKANSPSTRTPFKTSKQEPGLGRCGALQIKAFQSITPHRRDPGKGDCVEPCLICLSRRPSV